MWVSGIQPDALVHVHSMEWWPQAFLVKIPSPHIVTILFLVMRTFIIYALRNFQICNAVLSPAATLPYIMSPDVLTYNWMFVPLNTPTHFVPHSPPASGNPQSVLCIYVGFFFFYPHSRTLFSLLFREEGRERNIDAREASVVCLPYVARPGTIHAWTRD